MFLVQLTRCCLFPHSESHIFNCFPVNVGLERGNISLEWVICISCPTKNYELKLKLHLQSCVLGCRNLFCCILHWISTWLSSGSIACPGNSVLILGSYILVLGFQEHFLEPQGLFLVVLMASVDSTRVVPSSSGLWRVVRSCGLWWIVIVLWAIIGLIDHNRLALTRHTIAAVS